MIEMLSHVYAAFRPEVGATLYVPAAIADRAMIAAASTGYPWAVKLRGDGAPVLEVRR